MKPKEWLVRSVRVELEVDGRRQVVELDVAHRGVLWWPVLPPGGGPELPLEVLQLLARALSVAIKGEAVPQ